MEDRTRRIVETAIELAEVGGFEAVRLRDVAAKAGVALGTVYKRFPSKEDILVAALERLATTITERLQKKGPSGATPEERVGAFFKTATRALVKTPNLTKAVLRSVVSGEPDRADRVLQFHQVSRSLIVDALRGSDPDPPDYTLAATILQDVWFAGLVGWMGGLFREAQVVAKMDETAAIVLAGLRRT